MTASLRPSIAGGRTTILGSYIHGAAAVESIAMDGQSKVAAAVTHNSDSQ